MRVKSQTDDLLVTEDSAVGWGVIVVLGAAAVAGFAVFNGLALPDGPTVALISAAALLALIGIAVMTSVTASFDRQAGTFIWVRRTFVFSRRREARLDEVHEVILQSSRDETGRSYRAAVSLRGEVWPLADTYRDRASAERLIAAAERFFNPASAQG